MFAQSISVSQASECCDGKPTWELSSFLAPHVGSNSRESTTSPYRWMNKSQIPDYFFFLAPSDLSYKTPFPKLLQKNLNPILQDV